MIQDFVRIKLHAKAEKVDPAVVHGDSQYASAIVSILERLPGNGSDKVLAWEDIVTFDLSYRKFSLAALGVLLLFELIYHYGSNRCGCCED